MNGRQRRGVVLFALVLSTTAILGSQTGEDLPPLVSPDQWVALSDKAGIVIKGKARATGEARGRLWVKIDGRWLPTVLEQPPQAVPAQ